MSVAISIPPLGQLPYPLSLPMRPLTETLQNGVYTEQSPVPPGLRRFSSWRTSPSGILPSRIRSQRIRTQKLRQDHCFQAWFTIHPLVTWQDGLLSPMALSQASQGMIYASVSPISHMLGLLNTVSPWSTPSWDWELSEIISWRVPKGSPL